MKLNKVVMVEPKAGGHHVYSWVHLPRLGLPILGTIAARLGAQVRVFIEEDQQVPFSEVAAADLLCISALSATSARAYALADKARAAGVPVLMGGPHVSFMAAEALAHADWVLRGEAERSLPQLFQTLRADGDLAGVAGLSYREAGVLHHNPQDERPIDLGLDVPIPDFSLLAGRAGRRFHRGVIPVQTSRGCPHRCKFCSVTEMFGRRMRYAPVERVVEELDRHRGRGDQVFFYDDNFCASPQRTKTLLDHLLRKNTFMPQPLAQVSVRAAQDGELLALMAKAGFHTVFIGFESVNPQSLAMLHKRQGIEDIRWAIERFHRFGIRVHGMFVTGADADDVATIRSTAAFAIEEKIDTVQFLVLTPLPGTPLFAELDRAGRLLTRDWSLYDTHHAVFQPRRMSGFDLMVETFEAMGRFYSLPRMAGRLLRGQIQGGLTGLYARKQVKRWLRQNRKLLASARRELPDSQPALLRS